MIQSSNAVYYTIITVLCLFNKTNFPLISYYYYYRLLRHEDST